MPAKIKQKGIYCLEGLWDHGNIQDQTTVLPILDLLEKKIIVIIFIMTALPNLNLNIFLTSGSINQ